MNPRTAERVAARHLFAAFIPDKFFKAYETELKGILAKPFDGSSSMREIAYQTFDKVMPLFKRFVTELGELVPSARATLQDRLGMRIAILEKIVANYDQLRKDVRIEYADPGDPPRMHAQFYVALAIDEVITKATPNLGKAYKVTFSVDPAKVDALVKRALKKATPEVLTAISSDNGNLSLKYNFYREHVDKSIPRLVKKSKVDINFTGWFTFIRDMLAANYATEPRFSQFELYGMKVVVDDATVTPKEHDDYVKELDAAYHLLKKKKLGRAWYGLVFIECATCDGRPGVAGHYNVGKDHIKLFKSPWENTEILIHELGHRYWYKFMSEGQRAKFESLIRVHRIPEPNRSMPLSGILKPEESQKAEREMEAAVQGIRAVLKSFEGTPITLPFKEMVRTFQRQVWKVDLYHAPRELDVFTDEATRKLKEAKALNVELSRFLSDGNIDERLVDPIVRIDSATLDERTRLFEDQRSAFVAEGNALVTALEKAGTEYIKNCVRSSDEANAERLKEIDRVEAEREKEWEADARQILPVSGYGKTNTSEAFAEAFLHYVTDQRMNADQEASFKAVLLDKDRTAARVAERWVGSSIIGCLLEDR
jgi:hypothetical protein